MKNNLPSVALTMGLHNVNISMNTLVYSLNINESFNKKYERLTRLQNLYLTFIENGFEEFDWDVAVNEGYLSKNDYEIFSEELNGLTYLEGYERYLKYHS